MDGKLTIIVKRYSGSETRCIDKINKDANRVYKSNIKEKYKDIKLLKTTYS